MCCSKDAILDLSGQVSSGQVSVLTATKGGAQNITKLLSHGAIISESRWCWAGWATGGSSKLSGLLTAHRLSNDKP